MQDPTLRRRFRKLVAEEEARSAEQFVDLCICWELPDGQELYRAGGRWDQVNRCWAGPAQLARRVRLQPSQVDAAKWLCWWLQERKAGRPRDFFSVFLYGNRGGGKSYLGALFTVTALIDLPVLDGTPAIAWQVSRTDKDREELDRYCKEFLPPAWYRYTEYPRRQYVLLTGATLTNISVDGGGEAGAEALRRGRVDFLFCNEAGLMGKRVPFVGMARLRDRGGLGLFTANPSSRARWIYDLHEKARKVVKAGATYPIRFVKILSDGNDSQHRDVGEQVDQVLRDLDPAAARFDVDGEMARCDQPAYWQWNSELNSRPCPAAPDITEAFTKARTGRAYKYLGAADFQGTPHMAASVYKVFGTLVEPILWAVDDFVVDQGTEDDLLDQVEDAGYQPEDILWVGDASGQWQDGRHSRNGRDSFAVFRSRRFHIVPPTKPREEKHRPKNPPVEQRVKLVNQLLRGAGCRRCGKDAPLGSSCCGFVLRAARPQFFVDPQLAPRLETALKECEMRQGRYSLVPTGFYAHLSDTAGYMAWWVFPKPKAPQLRAGGNYFAGENPGKPRIWG